MKRFMLLLAIGIISLAFLIGSPVVHSKEPGLEGIAYVQGHGGHIAVVDLKTGEVGRIVHGKPSDALTVSEDGKTLYVFSLDGFSKQINVETGKQTKWKKLGKKHCGSAIAPDGTIWVSDMADGHVYVYDPKTEKLVDSFPVSKSICGISFSKDGKLAYVSDMPGGFISIIDVAKKKVTKKISQAGTFIHRHAINPDGTEIWQSDGKELDKGQPVGVGYADGAGKPGTVNIMDVKTGALKDSILVGGNVHDVYFKPEGDYAMVATRQLPEHTDSAIAVVEVNSKRVVKMYSACKKCHGALGVDVSEKVDGGRPFLCAIEVDWKRKAIPKSVESFASAFEKH